MHKPYYRIYNIREGGMVETSALQRVAKENLRDATPGRG